MAPAQMKAAVGTALLVWISFISFARGINFGFSEADFTRPEAEGANITVIKDQPNLGELFLTIRPLTYAEFDLMGLPLPSELDPADRPDPAEFIANGLQDFDNSLVEISFPATTSSDPVSQDIFIPFENDTINEMTEGFYVLIAVNRVLSNDQDEAASNAVRNGVALVRILDDDDLTLSFQLPEYSVREDAGMINDLVLVVKDDGMVSEQVLPIVVSANSITAMRGSDFQIPMDLQLVFQTSDASLGVPLNISDDDILEMLESFTLVLSVPPDPPQGYTPRDGNTNINIIDNESGVIGFERNMYFAMEGDGTVEVCIAILQPDLTLIAPDAFAVFPVLTMSGTAEGTGIDYVDFEVPAVSLGVNPVINPRMCFNITIIDDALEENDEIFNVLINNDPNLAFTQGNFSFDPIMVSVQIMDDDRPVVQPTVSMPPIVPTTTTETVTLPPPTAVSLPPLQSSPVPSPTPTRSGFGGDPHFSVRLPTDQLMCFSLQGEHGFTFNLISNDMLQMNALFIPDSRREEVTWIGAMGIVVKNSHYKQMNETKLRFTAEDETIHVGDKVSLKAKAIEKLTVAKGKATIAERSFDEKKEGVVRRKGPLEVVIDLQDVGLKFTVMFVKKNHLDMVWDKVEVQPKDSHGIIGQFFRPGVDIDEARRLLQLPGMEPVPVIRKPVWHFMEREARDEKLCWVAMNPGYQGKKLIQGHYLDYLVDDVLSTKFKFTKSK